MTPAHRVQAEVSRKSGHSAASHGAALRLPATPPTSQDDPRRSPKPRPEGKPLPRSQPWQPAVTPTATPGPAATFAARLPCSPHVVAAAVQGKEPDAAGHGSPYQPLRRSQQQASPPLPPPTFVAACGRRRAGPVVSSGPWRATEGRGHAPWRGGHQPRPRAVPTRAEQPARLLTCDRRAVTGLTSQTHTPGGRAEAAPPPTSPCARPSAAWVLASSSRFPRRPSSSREGEDLFTNLRSRSAGGLPEGVLRFCFVFLFYFFV